jgi:exopolysaccharide biosynthesis polyprenyl glycosylphosphotransferase
MTTYDDETVVDLRSVSSPVGGHPSPAVERRGPATAQRVSWASPTPFVPPQPADPSRGGATAAFNPIRSAELRRRRWARPLITRAVAGDAAVAATVWFVAFASFGGTLLRLAVGGLVALAAAAAWCTVLWLVRAYDSRRVGQGPEEFGMVGRAAALVLVVLALGSYSASVLLPRRLVLLAVPVAALLTCCVRYALRRWLHARRQQGEALMNTLVVGSPSAVDDVVRDLSTVPYHGYSVVGACVPSTLRDVGIADDVPIVGTLSDIPQAVIDHEVDVVIVAGSGLSSSSLRRLSWALDRTGADLVVAPGLVEVAGPRLRVRPAAGLSLLHVDAPEDHEGRLLGKALLDRTLGLVLFVAALPVIAGSALLVKLTSPGPAFFAQERMGRDGQPFTLWKLRSMVTHAETLRTQELLAKSDRDGLTFKMRRDPRVTPVGSVLRRFSLDELPQLWNVVRGDMSLVGPRPPLRSEYDRYHDAVHRRLRVKPGLTGLWQVSGRADLSWEESVRLDLRYVDNWSVALDLQIMWKTGRAVLFGPGAY